MPLPLAVASWPFKTLHIDVTDADASDTYVHDTTGAAVTYTNWGAGEPRHSSGECVAMDASNKWLVTSCTQTKTDAVCEFERKCCCNKFTKFMLPKFPSYHPVATLRAHPSVYI